MTPMHVPKDMMEAYEIRSGFKGLGEFLEQRGRIKLIDPVGFTCNRSEQ